LFPLSSFLSRFLWPLACLSSTGPFYDTARSRNEGRTATPDGRGVPQSTRAAEKFSQWNARDGTGTPSACFSDARLQRSRSDAAIGSGVRVSRHRRGTTALATTRPTTPEVEIPTDHCHRRRKSDGLYGYSLATTTLIRPSACSRKRCSAKAFSAR
jgi:hypothetical protein